MMWNNFAQPRPSQRLVLAAGLLLALAAMVGCGSSGGIHLGPGPNNGLLKGQYAFAFSGQAKSGGFVTGAGTFTADGNGNLSNGMEDITFGGSSGSGQKIAFAGKYSVGSDNRGNAILSGVLPGCNSWQFTLTGSSHGLMMCIGTGASDQVITGSGSIDLQDTTAFSAAKLTGNYVFGFAGLGTGGAGVSQAGDWTMDGNGNITRGQIDVNDSRTVTANAALNPGTYTVASNGRGTATISYPTNSGTVTQNFAFYIVNASDLKFVELDTLPTASGEVLTQAASPFSLATLKQGGYAFILGGADSGNNPLAAGGIATSDGNGNLTVSMDINDGGLLFNSLVTNGYTFDATGRFTVAFQTLSSFNLALYPAQNGTIELVDIDGNSMISGMAMAQVGAPFSASTVSGTYALNFVGTNLLSLGEEDVTGVISADGNVNLTGTLDINNSANSGSIALGVPLTSSTYTMTSTGAGTATINSSLAGFDMNTYQVSSNMLLFLDMDSSSGLNTPRVMTGVMQK